MEEQNANHSWINNDHRAFYSLDYAGGIERDMASLDQKSPYDIVEKRYDAEQIYKGLASLPEKQRNRIYAHYFLGMSKSSIARVEKVNESNVRQSIRLLTEGLLVRAQLGE